MKVDYDLTAFFISMLNKNGEVLEFLFDGVVPKMVLLGTYYTCLRCELFMPIELINKDEKIKLIERCRETGLKFTNETLTDAAKILYTINFINENT